MVKSGKCLLNEWVRKQTNISSFPKNPWLLTGFSAVSVYVLLYQRHKTKLELMSPREVYSCYGRAVHCSFGFGGECAGSQLGKMIPLRSHRESSGLALPPQSHHGELCKWTHQSREGQPLTGDWI